MTDNMSDEEILKLKKEITDARRNYYKHVIPIKMKKEKGDRYTFLVQCPFCKEKIIYRNSLIKNRFHYSTTYYCRNCHLAFKICNQLYKFEIDHYQKLDFLRKNYLLIRDKFLKSKI